MNRTDLPQGRLHDPFRYLGLHREAGGWVLRVFEPHAEAVWLLSLIHI